MKTVLIALIGLVFLSACSGTPKNNRQAPKQADSAEYDSKKPISFAEYRKWRDTYDTGSIAYAEYIEWEIKRRLWERERKRVFEQQ